MGGLGGQWAAARARPEPRMGVSHDGHGRSRSRPVFRDRSCGLRESSLAQVAR
jgi:hypothetical protein